MIEISYRGRFQQKMTKEGNMKKTTNLSITVIAVFLSYYFAIFLFNSGELRSQPSTFIIWFEAAWLSLKTIISLGFLVLFWSFWIQRHSESIKKFFTKIKHQFMVALKSLKNWCLQKKKEKDSLLVNSRRKSGSSDIVNVGNLSLH